MCAVAPVPPQTHLPPDPPCKTPERRADPCAHRQASAVRRGHAPATAAAHTARGGLQNKTLHHALLSSPAPHSLRLCPRPRPSLASRVSRLSRASASRSGLCLPPSGARPRPGPPQHSPQISKTASLCSRPTPYPAPNLPSRCMANISPWQLVYPRYLITTITTLHDIHGLKGCSEKARAFFPLSLSRRRPRIIAHPNPVHCRPGCPQPPPSRNHHCL